MDANKFRACVNRLYITQVIYLTFNPGKDSIAGLRRLIGLTRSKPGVRIEQHSIIPLRAVLESGDWQNVSRTVSVYGLMHSEQNLLAALARDLENVAVSEHGAKALFTSNKKRQEETASEIIRSVVDRSLVAEVTSWGVKIFGKLVEIDGLPAVEFILSNADTSEKLVSVAVDGWSGRIAVDGVWGDRSYIEPQNLRERIYSALTDHLDKITATVA